VEHEKVVDIKQRMIGAIIIISLAIIILPIIFSPDDDIKEHFEVEKIPPVSKDIKETFTHYDKKVQQVGKMPALPEPSVVPVDEVNKQIVKEEDVNDSLSAEGSLPEEEPFSVDDSISVEDSQPTKDSQLAKEAMAPLVKASKPQKTETPKVIPKPKTQYSIAQKPKEKTINKAYTLQLGSFSQQENALKLTKKLQAKKFKAYIEKIVLPNGTSYRVRIGPFLKYEQISLTQRKIKRQFKIDGKIVNY